MKKIAQILSASIITQNPTLFVMLCLTPLLATSTSVAAGLTMGVVTTLVLVFSTITAILVHKIIPKEIRIASELVIIAMFVSIASMMIEALLPNIRESLGIYLPLISVNCLILMHAELYAEEKTVLNSALDALVTGLGFTVMILILSVIRELLGSGSLFGFKLLGDGFPAAGLFAGPVGGFLILGAVLAAINFARSKKGV